MSESQAVPTAVDSGSGNYNEYYNDDISQEEMNDPYQPYTEKSHGFYGPSYGDNIEWSYAQPLPSVIDPIKWYFKPFPQRAKQYFISLFPFLTWIYRYNLNWLYGDLVAGLTVGIVVVPQGMSYAKVAGLPVQYGLYSSFIGVMLYCFFATSKDVSIGPVAVMSSETYKITHHVLRKVPGLTDKDLPMIAGVLSLICGGITMGLGVLRLGFLLEYIPMPAVLGFMTGSAFTIAVGQVPSLMGINKLLDTRDASYHVVINTLKQLKHSNVNAAFGLVSLFVLYFMKWGCSQLEKRDKRRRIIWFYLNTMRSALVIIFSTLISWGCYRIYGKTKISMIGHVPRGLQDVGVHTVDRRVASALAEELPIAVIVLVLEHIAIAKSFGRINEYRINPNQELIAIGISNLIGHFFQAYPNTGSFSRTALKSKCGVRTPLAGIFTGICVLVAIYALTDAFYYISNAALSAIIIHAVGDLIASYQATWKFYKVSPLECLIFIIDVFLCVFVTLEAGIYFSVAASLVLLLLKQTFPLGEFLGKVEFSPQVSEKVSEGDAEEDSEASAEAAAQRRALEQKHPKIAKARNYTVKLGHFMRRLRSKHQNKPDPAQAGEAGTAEEYREGQDPGDETAQNKPSDKTDNAENAVRSIRSGDLTSDSVEDLDQAILPSGPAEPPQEYTHAVLGDSPTVHQRWWPLSHNNINPGIRIVPPPPGIFVYRFRESLTYQNAAWQTDRIVDHIREHTKRNIDANFFKNQKLGDRPWNEVGPRNYKPSDEEDTRPILRAIIFDMSCSPHIDLTGAQVLWDCHQEVTKYACVPVEFHFAGILSPWARRALVNAGFGNQNERLPPHTARLVELGVADTEAQYGETQAFKPMIDTHSCYFHFDIPDLSYR